MQLAVLSLLCLRGALWATGWEEDAAWASQLDACTIPATHGRLTNASLCSRYCCLACVEARGITSEVKNCMGLEICRQLRRYQLFYSLLLLWDEICWTVPRGRSWTYFVTGHRKGSFEKRVFALAPCISPMPIKSRAKLMNMVSVSHRASPELSSIKNLSRS